MTAELAPVVRVIAAALPTDPDDGTAVVGYAKNCDCHDGILYPIWGHPEAAAAEVLAALNVAGYRVVKDPARADPLTCRKCGGPLTRCTHVEHGLECGEPALCGDDACQQHADERPCLPASERRPEPMAEGFADYGHDVWHCQTCHRLVTTIDANSDSDAKALLDAHTAFNCRTDPGKVMTDG